MTSLKERIAAAGRRRVDVPVRVSDPSGDEARVAAAWAVLLAAQAGGDPAAVAAARQEYATARAAVDAHYEPVGFVALHPAEFEVLVSAHTRGGNVDSDALLPELAAACAQDEDLRDVEYWARVLDPDTGSWTTGERDELYAALFTRLNYSVPAGGLGQG